MYLLHAVLILIGNLGSLTLSLASIISLYDRPPGIEWVGGKGGRDLGERTLDNSELYAQDRWHVVVVFRQNQGCD